MPRKRATRTWSKKMEESTMSVDDSEDRDLTTRELMYKMETMLKDLVRMSDQRISKMKKQSKFVNKMNTGLLMELTKLPQYIRTANYGDFLRGGGSLYKALTVEQHASSQGKHEKLKNGKHLASSASGLIAKPSTTAPFSNPNFVTPAAVLQPKRNLKRAMMTPNQRALELYRSTPLPGSVMTKVPKTSSKENKIEHLKENVLFSKNLSPVSNPFTFMKGDIEKLDATELKSLRMMNNKLANILQTFK